MALTQTEVSQLYVSLFGRASEGEGNQYWQANASDRVATANAMLETDAAKTYFGDTINDNQKFIEFIYLNTLGKSATDDPTGVAYWVAELEAGKSKGEVSVALIDATQDPANAGNAQDQFNNKVAVSNDASNKIFTFTTIEKFTSYIKDVDHTPASVTAATALVDADVVPEAGETYTLTTGVDAVVGTAKDDQFNGLAATNSVNGNLSDTFQSVDSLQGGNGNDKLTAQIGSAAAVTVGPNVAGIETFEITAFNASTLNLSSVSDLTTLTLQNSVAAATVTNAKSILDFTVKNQTADVELGIAGAAVAGVADSMNLTLNGANGGTSQDIRLGSMSAGGTMETLNITTTGAASNVTLGGITAATASDLLIGTTTLNITGDQALTADLSTNTGLTKVDASKATGNVTLDLTNVTAANKLAVTGGTGHDAFRTNAINKDMVIDGGAGTDKLTIVALAASLTTGPTVSNVESIVFAGDTGNTINFSKVTGVADITVTNDATASNLTVTKAGADLKTVTFNGTGAATVDAASTDGLVFGLADSTGKTDELTVNVVNVNANGAHVTKNDGIITTVNNLQANGIETINLATADMGAKTTTANGGALFTAFTATSLQTLNITSATYVDIDATALASTVKTVNAAEASGGISVNLSTAADSANSVTADKAVVVTGGAGDDSLLTVLGAVKTTINSGAGKDTITASAADILKAVTIDAGAGNDTINISGDTGTQTKTITTGDGADTVTVFTAAAAADNQTAVVINDFTVGSAGDKLDFSTNQSTIAAKVNYAEVAIGTAVANTALVNGLTVLTGGTAPTDLTAGNIETWLGDTDTNTAGNQAVVLNANTDDLYIAVSDGTDTGIYWIVGDGVNTAIAGDTTLLVTLKGISDPTKLNADNFSDFLA